MSDKKIFSFEEKRKQSIESKRRQFERVMFDEFLGVYSVIDDDGTSYPIKLVDISKEGCLFQVPMSKNAHKQFKSGVDLTLKIYFTKHSYIPAVVKIKHTQEYVDSNNNAFLRCGSVFDTSLPSFEALSQFIKFIYQYAEFSCVDKGEKKTYFL